MIEGVVNASLEAIVVLSLIGPQRQYREVEAVIDTGYNGFLTLPPALVSELGLDFVDVSPAFLADGNLVFLDVYDVAVIWDGTVKDIQASASDSAPTVGMSLLDGYDLSIQVRDGGRVLIQASE